ncbi:MAG: MMPL family transporter [Desulfuromonadaceae bacterium]|nr:MMPL family transporter [Desulfuromonadaceae bacterium]
MAVGMDKLEDMPVVKELKDFDQSSGNLLERLIFNNRILVVAVCALVTLALAYQTTKIVFNASFEKMIPQSQPFIKNYLKNKSELRGLGNSIRVVVENTQGDIFDPEYIEALKLVNDALFLTPGIDRPWMKSIWMPAVRWDEVTEEGFTGGPVMPNNYNGSQMSIDQLRQNIGRSGVVGDLVADNFKSAAVFCPLLDIDPASGKPLDYSTLSKKLEEIRAKFSSPAGVNGKQGGKIKIHIIGFAKLVGDLLDGLLQVMTYFLIAALIAAIVIFIYTRCIRSTLLVIACSIVAVVWQLGFVSTFGFELDPYSILVPFLVFAIGVSHGVQKMNGIMQDVGRGTHRLVAARYTFRRLFLAGMTALLADAVGFAVLMFIDIPVIKDLALTASIGVAVLIFTNLLLLPVLLSFFGVSMTAAKRSLQEETEESKGKGVGALWGFLDRFTERSWAIGAISVAGILTVIGFIISLNLKIGDLDPGAPELRPNSRYNQDNAFITANYALSSDQFAVILKTPPDGSQQYETLIEADRLAWALQQVPGVQTTVSLVDSVRQITAGSYEGSPKWLALSRNQAVLNYGGHQSMVNNPDLFNNDGTVMPIIAYLSDHKAATLERVVKVASDFAQKHNTPDRQFLLAAGSSGIEAATNIVVRESNRTMLLYVYSAVILLCFITFRSWRAVLVAVLPLVVTSVLCEALMVILGIGVKVATLPVIALGVGIGVDYALYLLSVQLHQQRAGLPLREAYKRAVQFTGKVVGLVGITLAAGVITWAFSPIKFQADMGILLTFMFLWNMIGALVLIPALSHFLLNDVKVKDSSAVPEQV